MRSLDISKSMLVPTSGQQFQEERRLGVDSQAYG
jgi:hypothetical protein